MTTVNSPAFAGTGTESAFSPDSTDFEAEARHALSGLDLRLADLRGKVRACERHLVDACRVSLSRVDASRPASMREDLMRLHEHHLVRLELSRDDAMHTPQELQRATQALIAQVAVIKDWQRAIDCAELFLGQQKGATDGDPLQPIGPASGV